VLGRVVDGAHVATRGRDELGRGDRIVVDVDATELRRVRGAIG
jgi:hypothetical protein